MNLYNTEFDERKVTKFIESYFIFFGLEYNIMASVLSYVFILVIHALKMCVFIFLISQMLKVYFVIYTRFKL